MKNSAGNLHFLSSPPSSLFPQKDLALLRRRERKSRSFSSSSPPSVPSHPAEEIRHPPHPRNRKGGRQAWANFGAVLPELGKTDKHLWPTRPIKLSTKSDNFALKERCLFLPHLRAKKCLILLQNFHIKAIFLRGGEMRGWFFFMSSLPLLCWKLTRMIGTSCPLPFFLPALFNNSQCPTNNALLMNFRLSSDAKFLLISTD